jgi:hypothetical protein
MKLAEGKKMTQQYGMSPAMPLERPRLSASALTSMILGILLCLPIGLLAIIFSIVGFGATKNGAMRGRGFAVTGLILGIVGTLGWSALGLGAWWLFSTSAEPRALTQSFVREISAGNIATAAGMCDPTIPKADLETLHKDIAKYGTFVDMTTFGINVRASSGDLHCELTGVIKFDKGAAAFQALVTKPPGGAWKITEIRIK